MRIEENGGWRKRKEKRRKEKALLFPSTPSFLVMGEGAGLVLVVTCLINSFLIAGVGFGVPQILFILKVCCCSLLVLLVLVLVLLIISCLNSSISSIPTSFFIFQSLEC
jgi:hypothetical protein